MHMLNNFMIVTGLMGLVVTQQSFGNTPQSEQQSEGAASTPYEIVVTPTMDKGDLRRLIVKIEDDFFEKFNEINQDEKFDILCFRHTPTMSHIPKRVCEPIFMLRTRTDQTSLAVTELAQMLRNKLDARAMQLVTDKDLRWSMKDYYRELQEKLEQVARDNDDFREIADALNTAKNALANFDED